MHEFCNTAPLDPFRRCHWACSYRFGLASFFPSHKINLCDFPHDAFFFPLLCDSGLCHRPNTRLVSYYSPDDTVQSSYPCSLVRTLATQVNLLRDYQQHKFFQSSPWVYAQVARDAPVLFEQIKKQVQAGRWEAEGLYLSFFHHFRPECLLL